MPDLTPSFDPTAQIAAELQLKERQVGAVIAMLAEGNTIPFIARYRKEATGNLDEVELRKIQERYNYVMELESRRQTILGSIEEQGKLTSELRQQIEACTTKTELEDIYLPYKPKRRTRATIAKERGLEPLAERILAQPADGSESEAEAFVDPEKEVPDVDAAWKGARDIVAERVAETKEVRQRVRELFKAEGLIHSEASKEYKDKTTKFSQYYDFREPINKIPSHRYLAIRRGEREDVLDLQLELEPERILPDIEALMELKTGTPFAAQLRLAIEDSYHRLLHPGVSTDIRVDLKLSADETAVEVFADNLRNLLMAAPYGGRPVIAIDPGLRTGCKCVALDSTGQYLDTMLFNLTKGDYARQRAAVELLAYVKKHNPAAVAVGNGTAGRETEAFVRQQIKEAGLTDVMVLSISESGASVYSASDVAREEFPELDLTVRGAISIGRRLQDPLAELVKVDPKSIGVGQYQHDVHQPLLHDKLGAVVESCVNNVGVELNTASFSLLAYVSGLGASTAKKIVEYRNQKGAFKRRDQLLEVSGLGPKTFEQAAGFLRIRGGEHPLDSSAVHPERYALVERIAKEQGVELADLIGNAAKVDGIDWQGYASEDVGLATLMDIREELKKPGRDPRAEFEQPKFRDDVHEVSDLTEGMELEGVVTNVTAFGAFVDVGVHQDGLVHVSQLSDRFVSDPNEVVKVGDKLKVRVLEVDADRKRISLTAKRGESKPRSTGQKRGKGPRKPQRKQSFGHNPFASL